ncbi:MAG TPA: CHASE3 domain-containing protein, partial [Pirellulales bacterium]|nr:CHASE3 domain-containing protein [Pirellulales bacterium]
MERTFDNRLRLGIALLAAVMAVNAALAYYNIQLLYATNRQVSRSHEVLAALASVLATVKDAETGQRGFLITGNPRYLAPYDAALAAMADDLREAERLVQDDPSQQARLLKLKQYVKSKFDELKATIDLRSREGFAAAQQLVLTDAGREDMDAMRAIVAQMSAEEHERLALRTAQALSNRDVAIVSGLVTAGLGLLAIGVFTTLLRRHLLARVAANEALRAQKELYRTTLTSIGDAVITTDAAGRVTMLNAVAESLTGWQNESAGGVSLVEVFHIVNEDTRLPVENPALRALAEGVIVGLANHTILVAKDGAEHPIDDSAAPIRDGAGRQVGAVLVFRDISERKRLDAMLEAQRELLQTTLESIGDAVITTDAVGCVTFMNRPAQELTGWTEDAAHGEPLETVFHIIQESNREPAESPVVKVLREGRVVGLANHTLLISKTGNELPIDDSAAPIKDANGQTLGVVL